MSKKKKIIAPRTNGALDLSKCDDETRRKFIQQCSFVLGLFGAPWLYRMESMEKLSKKILGSSVAYAQSGDERPIYWIHIASRAGEHNLMAGATAGDAVGDASVDGERNYFEASSTVQANMVDAATTGGNSLYPTAAFRTGVIDNANTPGIAQRMVSVNMVRNRGGHSNLSPNHLDGSAIVPAFNFKLEQQGVALTVPGGVAFGSPSTVDLRNVAGDVGVHLAPQYFGSVDGAISLVSSFQMSVKGKQLEDTTRDEALAFMQKINAPLIKTLQETRRDGETIESGMTDLVTLLKTDQAAQLLGPSGPGGEDFDARAAIYNTNLNGADNFNPGADLGEVAALFETAVQFGMARSFVICLSTGDWHGRPANMGVDNTGTPQDQHAQEFATYVANLYSRLNQIPDPNDPTGTRSLGDNTCITEMSEFRRGELNRNEANNTDGGNDGFVGIFPTEYARAGNYGSFNHASLDREAPVIDDPDGGSSPDSDCESIDLAHTILAALGMSEEERQQAGMMMGRVIQAIPKIGS